MDALEEREELREYREAVIDLAKNRTDCIFKNGHPDHAGILFETIFRYADETVRLFSGRLNSTQADLGKGQSVSIFGFAGIIAGVSYFLSKPSSILKILVENDIDQEEKNPFVMAIRQQAHPGHVEIRRINPNVSNWGSHFCVIDERGLRYELNHAQAKAVANFNDPKNAQKLAASFDRVFEKSKEYLFPTSGSAT